MSRLPVSASLIVALGAITLGARQEPQYRGGTNTVSIYATVLDQDGRLVPDLSRDDFDVYDNGVRQDLSLFANDLQPITIVVMLDRSGSMRPHFTRVREAAEVFVGDLLPDDRAKVGSFSDRIQIDPQDFTGDRDALVRILRENLVDPGTTPLWRATSEAMDALARRDGRRVVLLFTDGKDTPAVGRNIPFSEVRSRSQVEEIMVYGIGFSEVCSPDDARVPRYRMPPPGGPILYQRGGRGGPRGPGGPGGGRIPGGMPPGMPGGGRPPGMPYPGMPPVAPPMPPYVGGPSDPGAWSLSECRASGPDPDLRELAAVGGGGYFELRSTDDLRLTFARVADELHHQYLLAFTATKLDHTLHRLEVRVRQPHMAVRARRTYLAG
jgi:VWFA-related protein